MRGHTMRIVTSGLVAAAIVGTAVVSLGGATSAGYTDVQYAEVQDVSVPYVAPAFTVPPASRNLDTFSVMDQGGNVWMWGFYGDNNGSGPAGGKNNFPYNQAAGDTINYMKPAMSIALTNMVDVAGAAYADAGLDKNGNLWVWGLNNYNLWNKDIKGNRAPSAVPAGATNSADLSTASWQPIAQNVVSVEAGEYNFAWLTADGKVFTSGNNAYGARGQGTITAYTDPTEVTQWPAGKGTIVGIYSSYEGFFAVDDLGHAYYWGRSLRGGAGATDAELQAGGCTMQSTVYHELYCRKPVEIPGLTAVLQSEGLGSIVAGYAWGQAFTKQGNLYTWGAAEDNANGQGQGDTSTNGIFTPTKLASDVVSVGGAYHAAQFIDKSGNVWAFGNNLWGGAFSTNPVARTPVNNADKLSKVWDVSLDPQGRKATSVGGNKDGVLFALNDGSVYGYGENGGGAVCAGYSYGTCKDASGNVLSVTATGTANGLYVWIPAPIQGLQNVGKYITLTATTYPFEGGTVAPGDVMSVKLSARNDQTTDAAATIVDDLSALVGGATLDQASIVVSPNIGTVNVSGNTITWTGNLPKKSMVQITFNVTVKSNAAAGTVIKNSAKITVGGTEMDKDSSSVTVR